MRVGEFEFEVSQGYPCFIRIWHKDKEMVLYHYELRDLEYVVKRAIWQARQNLGKDRKAEVEK